ncbi:hypothetical protein CK203_082033 [Vitis vinifera]|uniref:RNase H type-1 domain-containing protein n=1 Tax=Vitis vinifera TaxID=29760 RepID=A0A438BWA0_VITVI|nr:hypothetical protein CK203_082033 [Vitis vinifera]
MLSWDDSKPKTIAFDGIYEIGQVTLGLQTPTPFKLVPEVASVQTTTVVPLTFPYYSAQTPFVLILDVEKVRTPYVDDVHIPDIQNVIRGSRVRCIDSSPEPDQSRDYHHSEGLSHMVTVGKAICIFFSDDDLPPEGSDHTHPLYISIGCSGCRVLSVLLDNGSALNVYPLATAIALGYAPSDFGPFTQTVLRIPTSFNLLLGRPWIHRAEAIPYSLHQKISHSDDDLFLTRFTFDEVQTLKMEDFHQDFVAMLFDQYGSTMVLDIMRSMSYLPGMGWGGVNTGPTMSLTDYFVRASESQMPSDGIIRDSVLFRRPSFSVLSIGYNIVDGAVPQDEYVDEKLAMSMSQIGEIVHPELTSPFDLFRVSVIEIAEEIQIAPTPEILDIDDDIARHDSDDDSSSASDLDPIDQRVSPAIEHTKVVDFGTTDQPSELKIGSKLSTDESDCLIQLLKSYLNIFAWSYEDMPGLNPSIVQHRLPLLPHARPYPEWLANVILIPKKDGKMKVCVDFQDLNKANPKDDFPLPHIDMLVDSTTDHLMLSFMDGFFWVQSDPHGSRGHGEDVIHYQVDYMIMKSRDKLDHLVALERFFKRIKQFRLRLNPKKCTFGVTSGKLLGYMVSDRGIEADPDKIRAIIDMPAPRTKRDITASWVDFSTSVDSLPDCRTSSIRWSIVADHLASLPVSDGRAIDDDFPNEDVAAVTSLSVGVCTLMVRLTILDTDRNNIVEYGACILGLETTMKLGIRQMEVFGDSNLVLRQIQDEWKTRDMKLRPYHAYLELLVQRFDDLRYTYLPKALNQFADALATLASMIDIHVEVWGINIIGKISPKSSNGHEFILVVIDYFTKWVEAASYARLTSSGILETDWAQARLDQLNLLDERRLRASDHVRTYQRKMTRAFKKRVKSIPLQRGDLVLKVIRGLIRDPRGKFKPNWSGPYFIRELTPKGTAWLIDLDRNEFSKPTNVDQLKRHYV